MKNNFIAKHMNTFNKSVVHKNVKEESINNSKQAIEEGLIDYDDLYLNISDECEINRSTSKE